MIHHKKSNVKERNMSLNESGRDMNKNPIEIVKNADSVQDTSIRKKERKLVKKTLTENSVNIES